MRESDKPRRQYVTDAIKVVQGWLAECDNRDIVPPATMIAVLSAHAQATVSAIVPQGYSLLKNSTFKERAWPEDLNHENGVYYCDCCVCGRQFQGHKRRVLCRVCTNETTSPHAAPVSHVEAQAQHGPQSVQESAGSLLAVKRASASVEAGRDAVQQPAASAPSSTATPKTDALHVDRYWPGGPRTVYKELLEEECTDGDRLLALFPELSRTEGGRLPVAKMVNAICDLSARCKRAEETSASATADSGKVPEGKDE